MHLVVTRENYLDEQDRLPNFMKRFYKTIFFYGLYFEFKLIQEIINESLLFQHKSNFLNINHKKKKKKIRLVMKFYKKIVHSIKACRDICGKYFSFFHPNIYRDLEKRFISVSLFSISEIIIKRKRYNRNYF